MKIRKPDILRKAARLIFGAPASDWKKYAKFLRETAEEYGANDQPILLQEAENCRRCGHLTSLLMQPTNLCGECWQGLLPEARIIPQLSFWPDCLRIVQACQDAGECPFEGVTVDLDKASIADNEKLAGIKNPVAAVEHQLTLLFIRENVADKMEARREGNLLYICSPSW